MKTLSMILVVAVISLLAITSVEAGSRVRPMFPGAEIAVGALVLGGFVAHHMAAHARQPEVVYAPPPHSRYRPPEREWEAGHWEMIREWVPGTWE